MNLEKSRNEGYQKCAALLSLLIGMDAETEGKVYRCFLSMGIKSFFIHLELLDLPQEYIEKLRSIKSVLGVADERGGQA